MDLILERNAFTLYKSKKRSIMDTFKIIEQQGEHEQVLFCRNKDVGLKAIIAIHSTVLGPALGGTRMWQYSCEEQALIDVLRLSKGMTYKAAAIGLNIGGGKAVIIGDPKTMKSERLFRAFGQQINSLNGRYVTAEDVGICVEDMEYIAMETPWVTGGAKELGGSGDPSPHTVYGVFLGIKASIEHTYQTKSVDGMTVAIQGLGKVGENLALQLHKNGAKLILADIDTNRVEKIAQQTGAQIVDAKDILFVDCDILAPCALGGIFNDQSIPQLKTKIIAGAANNQLVEQRHGQMLYERGILYAPDYMINAGGLINCTVEFEGYSLEKSKLYLQKIYQNLLHIFHISDQEKIACNLAANKLAEERLEKTKVLRQFYQNKS